MAVDWIRNQRIKSASYVINADSKAALIAIANRQATHPLVVDTRRKTTELRTATSITYHWIRGHTSLEGNERADYLARKIASYNPTITYDALPVHIGKQLLEDYYTKIWNATYVNVYRGKQLLEYYYTKTCHATYANTAKNTHTKSLIPSISHRMTPSLWPNHFLTQLLTNHGAASARTSIKWERYPHHYVLVPKKPNKRRDTP